MRFPEFYLVGAPKCGTTAMNEYLRQHPEIFIPEKKELHYFGSDLQSPWFTRDLNRYLSYYEARSDERMAGDASVWYLYSRKAAEEIHAVAPQAKILIMLRDPVEMMYSNYYQMLYNGNETASTFYEAIFLEPYRRKGLQIPRTTHFKESLLYTETAMFHEQVNRYVQVFGKHNVKVVLFDDLVSDTATIYKEVLDFLGVDPDFQAVFTKINSNKIVKNQTINHLVLKKSLVGKALSLVTSIIPAGMRSAAKDLLRSKSIATDTRPQLATDMRIRLYETLAEDIALLQKLIDRDLSKWKLT